MEAQKWLDSDSHRSTEIEAALKRFEDVCNSLEDQHTKLLNLEKRREKLNEDLQSLRNEIKKENNYFRSVVNENAVDGLEGIKSESFGTMVEPPTLDTVSIKEFIKIQKEELANSIPEKMGLDCLKEYTSSSKEGVKYLQKATVEPIDHDEEKCIITEICYNGDIEIIDTAEPSMNDD